jgi:hypothetical protein
MVDLEALHLLVQFAQTGCLGENATAVSACDTVWKAVADKILKARTMCRISDTHVLACMAVWSTWTALPSIALPNAMFAGLFDGRDVDALAYLYEAVVLPMLGVDCRALYALAHILQRLGDKQHGALLQPQMQRAVAGLKQYIATVDVKTIYALYALNCAVKLPEGVEAIKTTVGAPLLVALLPRQYPDGHAAACILTHVDRHALVQDTDVVDTLVPLLGTHAHYDVLWQHLRLCRTCHKMLRRHCTCRAASRYVERDHGQGEQVVGEAALVLAPLP